MKNAKHSNLPIVKIHAVRQQARQAAFCDHDLGREPSAARAAWWVAHLSHELGIVDAGGMIDLEGEAARLFKAEYRRMYRSDAASWPVGH